MKPNVKLKRTTVSVPTMFCADLLTELKICTVMMKHGSLLVAINHMAFGVIPSNGVLTMSDSVRFEPCAVTEHDGDYYCIDKN